jgi:hypothetical protein
MIMRVFGGWVFCYCCCSFEHSLHFGRNVSAFCRKWVLVLGYCPKLRRSGVRGALNYCRPFSIRIFSKIYKMLTFQTVFCELLKIEVVLWTVERESYRFPWLITHVMRLGCHPMLHHAVADAFFPVYVMKVLGRKGGVAPLVLNLGNRWRWVISLTLQPLHALEKEFPEPLSRNVIGPQN